MAERSSPEKTRPSFFWLLACTVVPLIALLARVRITSDEKLPRRGAFVLAPNHYTELDPLIVGLAVWRLGRAPRFMTKDSLFRIPVLGWVLRSTGMVPVARTSSRSGAEQTLKHARELVTHDRGVIVYPEGTLTRDPELWPMRGRAGAIRLALAGDIPLIPVAHWGAQRIMGRYAKRISLWPPRKLVRVVFGDPIDLSDLRSTDPTPAQVTAATDRLMGAIAVLLGELRGQRPPTERWDPKDHGQSETGRI